MLKQLYVRTASGQAPVLANGLVPPCPYPTGESQVGYIYKAAYGVAAEICNFWSPNLKMAIRQISYPRRDNRRT